MSLLPMKAGQIIAGRYRLDARLGIGGMGEVWRATHHESGREYALKFMHPHVATSATARQRFTREAKVSAKINHPNVIDIFDVGEADDDALYLAMELLDGVTLADALHATQPLSVAELVTIVHDTARALAAAHAVNVIHRDLKPGNIYLHTDRATGLAYAKILDFGISKLVGESEHTKTGAVLGSPRYMSPEQTRSAANVDRRSDLWSMGVILFEGLTGTWPHEGDSFSSLVLAICSVPPTSIDLMVPSLPEALRAIVRDCLKPLNQRLASATELAERLAAALADKSLSSIPLPRPLQGPSDSVRAVSHVRVRPFSFGSFGSFDDTSDELDSLRITAPRQAFSSAQAYDDDATHVRPQQLSVSPEPAPAPTMAHVFKPTLKTIPLNQAAAMHAELRRAGVFGAVPPSSTPSPPASIPSSTGDPLIGTRSNFETCPSVAHDAPPSLVAPPLVQPSLPVAPASPASGRGLRWVAAVLSLLLVAIVIALTAVLRSSPNAAATHASSDAPQPSALTAAPPSPSTASPIATTADEPATTTTAVPTTSASSAPANRAPPRLPSKGPSKVKQLGSGL